MPPSCVTHAAIEASSHGLDQRRLDGIRIAAAAFTNLGRDHMDYHATVADYLAAKLRLFTTILPAAGVAVIDMDGAYSDDVATAAGRRRLTTIRVGRAGGVVCEVVHRLHVGQSHRDRLVPNLIDVDAAKLAAGVVHVIECQLPTELAGAAGGRERAEHRANTAVLVIDLQHLHALLKP